MSTTSFVAIAIISVFASIVYEFTVISRFLAEQKLKCLVQRPTARGSTHTSMNG
jgi:hypothetical protein